jgi:hypothetical protein
VVAVAAAADVEAGPDLDLTVFAVAVVAVTFVVE